MKNYEHDYQVKMAALERALHKREQLDLEIKSLQEQVSALETLIRAAYPHKGQLVLDQNTTPAQALVNVAEPQITARVRGLLMASKDPLTSGEIHEKLRGLGWDLREKSNPWALIHGICRRLVDQKFAQEVDKGGRKAWTVAK
jgi:hypothetical protein